ncbi:MAG: citrate (Si)-synthase, partial [Phycisphaerales bacterium]|nr:citrate (Si)-synthase [Phycisphaerales bacterium]
MANVARVTIDEKTLELPIVVGTEGERGIDISQLRQETGVITLDPGYGNTGSCLSAITYIDGDKGILRYRGIPIEEFDRPKPDFLEVMWLLIFGKFPTPQEFLDMRETFTTQAHLHETMKHHFEGYPVTAPPMAIISAMLNALGCFHPEIADPTDELQFQAAIVTIVSKIRTIAAFTYRRARGLPYVYADPRRHYCADLLQMMF